MRVHRLTFSGLGPFKQTQTIEFGRLAESPLFLLEGPTGSGKSTIIDAIVFALYGSVAGAEADEGRLVSQYRDPHAEPFVDLIFETAAGVYRVRRTPCFERPKQRGTGTTTQNATATLWRLPSTDQVESGDALSTRPSDVGAEIERLIGLTKRQFIGTVVLPQGEFAAFLQADVASRRAILQRIFRTDLYEKLQKRLRDAKSQAEVQRRQARQQIEVAAGRFCQAAELDDWACPEETGAVEAATAEVIDRLTENLTAVEAARERAESDAKSARLADEAVRRREMLQQRLREALKRKVELETSAAEQKQRLDRHVAAERAARVAVALSGESNACIKLELSRKEEQRLRFSAPSDLTELPIPDLERAFREGVARVAELRSPAELEDRLPERASALSQAQAELRALQDEETEVDARLEELPIRQRKLRSQVDEAQQQAGQVDALEQREQRLAAQAHAAEKLVAAELEQKVAEQRTAEAVAAASHAEKHLHRLRQAHYRGMAAELAERLIDDDPCPVCGSEQHPAPAERSNDHVGRDEVNAAEQQHRALLDELGAARDAATNAKTRVAALQAQAGGRDVAGLSTELIGVRAALAAAQAAARLVPQMKTDHGGIEQQLQSTTERRSELLQEIAKQQAQIGADRRTLESDRKSVEVARAGFVSVAEHCASLRERIDAIIALVAAARATENAAADHAQRESELVDVLATEGFATADDARGASLSMEQHTQLTEAIDAYREEENQVRALLSDPDLAGIDIDEHIDTEASAVALKAATAASEAAGAAHTAAAKVGQEAEKTALELVHSCERRDHVEAATAAAIMLGKIVMGESSRLGMALATYVLQQRFHAVVAAANDHLRVMSDGNLTLEAHGEADDKRCRAGLGLRVIDLRTGDQARSTGTLSGGETFYTALSLALGLASVVTSEAGGVSLGTLFVDEGFGSLDSSTLDDVLAVLTSLHGNGRAVGVVSHVEELKTRIPDRIEVRREHRNGPSTVTLVA